MKTSFVSPEVLQALAARLACFLIWLSSLPQRLHCLSSPGPLNCYLPLVVRSRFLSVPVLRHRRVICCCRSLLESLWPSPRSSLIGLLFALAAASTLVVPHFVVHLNSVPAFRQLREPASFLSCTLHPVPAAWFQPLMLCTPCILECTRTPRCSLFLTQNGITGIASTWSRSACESTSGSAVILSSNFVPEGVPLTRTAASASHRLSYGSLLNVHARKFPSCPHTMISFVLIDTLINNPYCQPHIWLIRLAALCHGLEEDLLTEFGYFTICNGSSIFLHRCCLILSH